MRVAAGTEAERYEICAVAPRRRVLLATASTLAEAHLALRTLLEEGEGERGELVIRDTRRASG